MSLPTFQALAACFAWIAFVVAFAMAIGPEPKG
jgi:hypothetical protein